MIVKRLFIIQRRHSGTAAPENEIFNRISKNNFNLILEIP